MRTSSYKVGCDRSKRVQRYKRVQRRKRKPKFPYIIAKQEGIVPHQQLCLGGLYGTSEVSRGDLERALREVTSLDRNGVRLQRFSNLVLLGESAGDSLKKVLGEQYGPLVTLSGCWTSLPPQEASRTTVGIGSISEMSQGCPI